MSDSNCPTGVRHVSVRLSAGHLARVGQVSGRCPTGGPTTIRRPTEAPRQVCDRRVRQILGRFPTGVCDRCPTGVRRPTGTVQQVSGTCPTGSRQVSDRRVRQVADRCPASDSYSETGVRQTPMSDWNQYLLLDFGWLSKDITIHKYGYKSYKYTYKPYF